ncbi:MAG TPA: hypothetical protein VIY48_17650 [Candidatus Paceibacterota bacterium]
MSRLDVLKPGDVLAVNTGNNWAASLIRLGQRLQGKPSFDNHVVAVHHRDPGGRLWGIEGRPGGVGWVDIAQYDNKFLVSNAAQPKTDEQRNEICAYAAAMLGTQYDWTAIIKDTLSTFHLDAIWMAKDFGPQAPAHVVCSSVYAWIYKKVGLEEPPTTDRWTEPADWVKFFIEKGWARQIW